MKIYEVSDKEFAQFGKVLDIDVKEIVAAAEKFEIPDEGSIYKASCEEFECLDIMQTIKNEYFGGLPTQLGYWLGSQQYVKCS